MTHPHPGYTVAVEVTDESGEIIGTLVLHSGDDFGELRPTGIFENDLPCVVGFFEAIWRDLNATATFMAGGGSEVN